MKPPADTNVCSIGQCRRPTADIAQVDSDEHEKRASDHRQGDVNARGSNTADHETRCMEEAHERIAEAFNWYFGQFGIRIRPEDVVTGARRSIGDKGWRIDYRVDPDDAGLPSLEYYAGHRMTNDRHVLIWADGYRQRLDAMEGFIVWNPNVPGSREAAEQAARERDGAIRRYLRDRGIYPGSGIHGDAGVGAIGTDDEVGLHPATGGDDGDPRVGPPTTPSR
jgi:hypothetical protein